MGKRGEGKRAKLLFPYLPSTTFPMAHSASKPAPAFAARPWLNLYFPDQTGSTAPPDESKTNSAVAGQSEPQRVLASRIALGYSGRGAFESVGSQVPPLLAAPASAAQALTAELGSAGWQAYLRGLTRDLAYKTNSISEEQINAIVAVNGARTSEHGAAHRRHVQALDEANQLEVDAKTANTAAARLAQEAAAARHDAQSKAGVVDKAGKDLAALDADVSIRSSGLWSANKSATLPVAEDGVADDLVQRAQKASQNALREANVAARDSRVANNARLEAAQALAQAQAELAFEETTSVAAGARRDGKPGARS